MKAGPCGVRLARRRGSGPGVAERGELSFVPVGLFLPPDVPPEQARGWVPSAHAMASGCVRESSRRTNAATGVAFQWLLLETYGGTLDVVAELELLPETPPAGSIVRGTFWLSGHIREIDRAAPPSLRSRLRHTLRQRRGRGGLA